MKNWFTYRTKAFTRRLVVGLAAVAMVLSLAAYEFASPARAAASPAIDSGSRAADDNSVSALLSLDHAMETVAARVTPAVVNITVTSKTVRRSAQASERTRRKQQSMPPNGLQPVRKTVRSSASASPTAPAIPDRAWPGQRCHHFARRLYRDQQPRRRRRGGYRRHHDRPANLPRQAGRRRPAHRSCRGEDQRKQPA